MKTSWRKLLLLFLLPLTAYPACSIKRLAINSLAESLAASGDVFGSDDDPELVRQAVPFALKTMESLLAEAPNNRNLLLAACQGFTQYAYAFVETDADLVEADDYFRAVELRERALRLYLRARRYGQRGLELKHPGISEQIKIEPEAAAARVGIKEIPFLYWTGAAWGSAISLGQDRPELVADVSAVRSLMNRALELDDGYESGAIHEAMIGLESLPEMMGGSMDRAREHFERAVELSGGVSASPYVSLAVSVSVPAQDRKEFEAMLRKALEIDPDRAPGIRLANLIVQKKARALLTRTDDLFIE